MLFILLVLSNWIISLLTICCLTSFCLFTKLITLSFYYKEKIQKELFTKDYSFIHSGLIGIVFFVFFVCF